MYEYNLTNITIQVPQGTEQHGNDRLLCVHGPAWKDALTIITFFATNYIAHAATVKTTPGEGWALSLCNMLFALMFPMSGLLRSLNAIARLARFGGSEIHNACRAGALCMVVRGPGWLPDSTERFRGTMLHNENNTNAAQQAQQEDNLPKPLVEADFVTYLPSYAREDSTAWAFFDTIGSRAFVDRALTRIHGRHVLPEGYRFAIVPRKTTLCPLEPSEEHVNSDGLVKSSSDVSSSYSAAKALASLIQALAAFNTLLGRRNDLIQQWGYASYHLTVIPYLVMTILNFIANLLTADYPCLYVVKSATMDEARRRGGTFTGLVATTLDTGTPPVTTKSELAVWEGLKEAHIEIAASAITMMENPVALNAAMSTGLRSFQRRLKERPREPQSCVTNAWFRRHISQDIETHVILECSTMDTFRALPNLANESAGLGRGYSRHIDQYRGSMREAQNFVDQGLVPLAERGTLKPLLQMAASYNTLAIAQTFVTVEEYIKTWRLFKEQSRRLRQDLPDKLPFRQKLQVSAKAYRLAVEALHPREGEDSNRPIIYVPACPRFRRSDDFTSTLDKGTGTILHAVNVATFGTWWRDPGIGKSSHRQGHVGLAMLVEVTIGCLILGLLLLAIAVLSNWFDPGKATTQQKVIMLFWICEGTIGLLLPLLSAKELLLIFLFLPFYAFFRHTTTFAVVAPTITYVKIVAVLPLGIFVAPIWGFVIVGQMLLQWGTCVVLY